MQKVQKNGVKRWLFGVFLLPLWEIKTKTIKYK
jgi:hypothetical protein